MKTITETQEKIRKSEVSFKQPTISFSHNSKVGEEVKNNLGKQKSISTIDFNKKGWKLKKKIIHQLRLKNYDVLNSYINNLRTVYGDEFFSHFFEHSSGKSLFEWSLIRSGDPKHLDFVISKMFKEMIQNNIKDKDFSVLELFLKIESSVEKNHQRYKNSTECRNEKLKLLFKLNYDGMTLFTKSIDDAEYTTDSIRKGLCITQKIAYEEAEKSKAAM